MNRTLERLDSSMKNLTLNLTKYREDDYRYQETLKALADQYQVYKEILQQEDNINNLYCFKYADIAYIESILLNTGYIEKSKKSTTR